MRSATDAPPLAAWLVPGNPPATESLVRSSGLARLEELAQLATYLASRPGFEGFAPTAVATLEQFEGEPADLLFRRLASPVFRGWLSRFGMLGDLGADDPGVRTQLALWPNMRHGFLAGGDFEATMAVVAGYCTTWDTRLALAVGRAAGDHVRVTRERGRLTVRSGSDGGVLIDATVLADGSCDLHVVTEGCGLRFSPSLPGSEIALRNDLPPLQLRLLDTERETAIAHGALDHSRASYPPFDPAPYLEAAGRIDEAWPAEYADFCRTLHVVVPRSSPPGWRARGMTVSSHAGAIWLFVDGAVDLVEHMVHEQSHVKLRYIEDACPILAPDQSEERFAVAWRNDPRPLVGIFEGVYVHLHVLMALVACLDRRVFDPADADSCSARALDLAGEVDEGLRLLVEHARFTDAGGAFVGWAEESLERLRSAV